MSLLCVLEMGQKEETTVHVLYVYCVTALTVLCRWQIALLVGCLRHCHC